MHQYLIWETPLPCPVWGKTTSSRPKTTSSGHNLACFQQSLHSEIQNPKPLSPKLLTLRSAALWSLPPAAAQLPASLSQMPSLELHHILYDSPCLRMSSYCLVVHQEMAQGNLLVIGGNLWSFPFVSCYVCYAAWEKYLSPSSSWLYDKGLPPWNLQAAENWVQWWYSHFSGSKLSYSFSSSRSLGAVSLHLLSKTIK